MFPDKWLQEEATVEQLEAENTLTEPEKEITDIKRRMKRWEQLQKPFGYCNAEWEKLKSQMKPGDVLRKFCSDIESWRKLAGRKGIALVRGGIVIAVICTTMN